jgi:hypothetical protein
VTEPEFATNPYVATIFKAAEQRRSRRGYAAKPEFQGSGEPKNLMKIIGFLRELSDGSSVRVYLTPEFDEGIDVLKADVVYRGSLPQSREDGLERDVVVVQMAEDADDVIYWTKKSRVTREPRGGDGVPTNIIRFGSG